MSLGEVTDCKITHYVPKSDVSSTASELIIEMTLPKVASWYFAGIAIRNKALLTYAFKAFIGIAAGLCVIARVGAVLALVDAAAYSVRRGSAGSLKAVAK